MIQLREGWDAGYQGGRWVFWARTTNALDHDSRVPDPVFDQVPDLIQRHVPVDLGGSSSTPTAAASLPASRDTRGYRLAWSLADCRSARASS